MARKSSIWNLQGIEVKTLYMRVPAEYHAQCVELVTQFVERQMPTIKRMTGNGGYKHNDRLSASGKKLGRPRKLTA